ncbi:MAG: hypothetical protein ACHP84_11450 [Caulobacterales bacterium]
MAQVHYELFVRRLPSSPWSLDMAGEDRAVVVETAEALLAEKRVAAVRVTRETLDEEAREFSSVTILSKGHTATAKPKKVVEDREPLCVSPSDLYSGHARDRIGRLLEAWLTRHQATAFELLHRADLVERLEAAGIELQHAIQKVAVPEAQARGLSTHELMRSFQGLAERAIARVLKDAKRNAFPDLERESFASAADSLMNEPERVYLLGGAVAGAMATARGWSSKVSRLLDLADAAPIAPPARALAFEVLEQPLSEILESKAGMADLLGPELDLGGRLAAMTRLAAKDAVQSLIDAEPAVASAMPPLEGPAIRLAEWLEQPGFSNSRAAIARRVLRELNGPRRLRAADPAGEIKLLRALAMALTAASGQTLPLDDVQAAFVARSRMLVTAEFVEAFLGRDGSAREEAEALIWLVENVIGAANKRHAARYLAAHVGGLRFEKEMRYGPDSAAMRLAALAALQRSASRAGLVEEDLGPIRGKIGEVGGMVEADAKLIHAVVQASAPIVNRLTLLLKLSIGDTAPNGPVSERARQAALKLMRTDEAKAELAAAPEEIDRVRDMLKWAGLAA